jgi:nucleoside-diphosphate-sugar epimerase
MRMGKTLVTGASGFTGRALCRRLAEDGEQVVAFVRPTSDISELLALGVECRRVDIRDATDVKDNFSGITTVYHVAAAYRTEHGTPGEFLAVNVDATRNLLEAGAASRVTRFIHCSTVGVQGQIDDPPADEAYRCNPGDHYQSSKLEGELLARKAFADGLPGTVVRPVGIYGPGDTRFLKLFRPIAKGYFVMIGRGDVLYHLTYIEDLVQGILLCGRRDEAEGEVFTIAGPEYTTIRALVDLIADVLGRPRPRMGIPFMPVYAAAVLCERICRLFSVAPPLYPRRVEFFCKDRAFSIEKAARMLGYVPRIALREGLTRTAAWYREEGLI